MTDQNALITADQARVTLGWLATFPDTIPLPQATLVTFARCCLLLNEALTPDTATAAQEADVLGRAILTSGRDDLDLDPLILSAHYIMLEDAGMSSQPLRDVLERIVAALSVQPAEIYKIGRVRHTARLLRDVGFALPAVPNAGGGLVAAKGQALLSMPIDAIIEMLDNAAADRSSIDDETTTILSLVALAELRNYHIDRAAKMLRMMIAAGCANPFLDEAVAFVALQRATNGSYGFFDPFKDDAPSPQERALSFHLPITLNAVWLLNLRARGARGVAAQRAAAA